LIREGSLGVLLKLVDKGAFIEVNKKPSCRPTGGLEPVHPANIKSTKRDNATKFMIDFLSFIAI
jgi:hypothetical protein